jgi:hypothetical protein
LCVEVQSVYVSVEKDKRRAIGAVQVGARARDAGDARARQDGIL